MKGTFRYLFNVFLSLILIFTLLAALGSYMMQLQAVNPAYFRRIVAEQQLPKKIHDSLAEEFQQQEHSSGIPASVYDNAIAEENLAVIINGIIENGISYIWTETHYLGYKADFSVLQNDLRSFFESYAAENGYPQDEVYEKALHESMQAAQEQIMTQCDVFCMTKLSEAGALEKLRSKMPNPFWLVPLGMTLLVGLFVSLLLMNNIKEKRQLWYWCGISLLIVSLLVMIPAAWVHCSRWFDRFAIKSTQIFSAVRGYLYGLTDTALLISVIGTVLAIGMLVLFAFLAKQKTKKE